MNYGTHCEKKADVSVAGCCRGWPVGLCGLLCIAGFKYGALIRSLMLQFSVTVPALWGHPGALPDSVVVGHPQLQLRQAVSRCRILRGVSYRWAVRSEIEQLKHEYEEKLALEKQVRCGTRRFCANVDVPDRRSMRSTFARIRQIHCAARTIVADTLRVLLRTSMHTCTPNRVSLPFWWSNNLSPLRLDSAQLRLVLRADQCG